MAKISPYATMILAARDGRAALDSGHIKRARSMLCDALATLVSDKYLWAEIEALAREYADHPSALRERLEAVGDIAAAEEEVLIASGVPKEEARSIASHVLVAVDSVLAGGANPFAIAGLRHEVRMLQQKGCTGGGGGPSVKQLWGLAQCASGGGTIGLNVVTGGILLPVSAVGGLSLIFQGLGRNLRRGQRELFADD